MVKTWIVVAHQAGAPEGETDTDRTGRSFRKVMAVSGVLWQRLQRAKR
jgi:hypothetical protein